jgi:hypothetical protein
MGSLFPHAGTQHALEFPNPSFAGAMRQTIQYPAFVKLDLLHPHRGFGFDQ